MKRQRPFKCFIVSLTLHYFFFSLLNALGYARVPSASSSASSSSSSSSAASSSPATASSSSPTTSHLPSPMISTAEALISSSSEKENVTLYAAGFFPVSSKIPEGAIGRGVIPAVELALKHINNSPKILRGIHLDLVWNDTECDAAMGMKTFFDMLYSPPPKIILFGDVCTHVTTPIAKASRFFHLIQLSYADTHPMYTSESYPNFFRVVPSESAFNPARVSLMQTFNWTRVGTIYQNAPRYSLPHSKLLTDLDKAGIEIAFTQSIADETDPDLSKLKEKDVRIIVGSFDENWAPRIFCQAYHLGLYGRKYQWILGAFDTNWWNVTSTPFKKDPHVTCDASEILTAINGLITLDVLPLSSSREITVSGMTPQEYEAEYNRERQNEYSKFHGYAYDGVWTIAYAIHLVNQKLRSQNLGLTLANFKYRDPIWATFLREALNETSFDGVTGHVSFDGNERRGSILLKQLQGNEEVSIGEYHSVSNVLEFSNVNTIKWPGSNTPPVDRTFRRILPSRVSLTLFIIITIFAVCGIILSTVFLAFNIKYRNQKYIKMSSPYLNNLIIIGCILTYTSVILLGLDSSLTSENNFPYICAARAWVLMSGFTLAFGAMFSKTWRVHAIFTNIKLNKKIIKDYKLFMVVGVLVFIDVATLTTWQILDPFYRETNLGVPVPSPQNEDILVVPEMEFCQSKRMTVFLGSIYVYKGLLMAFGIFLAWETRHVSIPALNDSKYIGMSVYNVVIMCVIGAGLSFVLRDQQDAAFVIISIFIIFCSTATLCLVFVPKLIELNSNPDAGERRVRATLKPLKSRRDSDEMELQQRIKLLTDENCRSRQRLKERTYELEALLFRLRGLTESKRQGEEDDSDIEMVVTDDHLDITNAVTASSPPSSPPLATTVTGVPSSSLVTSSVHEETSKKYSTDSSVELMSPGSKKQIYVIVGNRELNRSARTSVVPSLPTSPITSTSTAQMPMQSTSTESSAATTVISSSSIIRKEATTLTTSSSLSNWKSDSNSTTVIGIKGAMTTTTSEHSAIASPSSSSCSCILNTNNNNFANLVNVNNNINNNNIASSNNNYTTVTTAAATTTDQHDTHPLTSSSLHHYHHQHQHQHPHPHAQHQQHRHSLATINNNNVTLSNNNNLPSGESTSLTTVSAVVAGSTVKRISRQIPIATTASAASMAATGSTSSSSSNVAGSFTISSNVPAPSIAGPTGTTGLTICPTGDPCCTSHLQQQQQQQQQHSSATAVTTSDEGDTSYAIAIRSNSAKLVQSVRSRVKSKSRMYQGSSEEGDQEDEGDEDGDEDVSTTDEATTDDDVTDKDHSMCPLKCDIVEYL